VEASLVAMVALYNSVTPKSPALGKGGSAYEAAVAAVVASAAPASRRVTPCSWQRAEA